jgi:DNA-binding LacI/PurR family transcriptional regulator
MVTIRELAKMTGYSTTMISRVLNHFPYVDEKKREEILKTIEETNYRPNSIARNLSLGKTSNIGVIVPYIHNPYFEQLVSGILEEAFLYNYKVTLLPTNYDKPTELKYLEEFSTKRYDGLIITSKANNFKKILEYQQYGPLIFCDDLQDNNVASVYINREKAFFDILSYFNEHQIKKIGITTGRDKHISSSTKLLLKLATTYLSHFDSSYVFGNCMNYKDGYNAAQYFYEQNPVQGIITNGDEVSAGMHEFYKDKELSPLLIGQDNLLISQLLNISTIDYHLIECGRQAFSLFIENKKEMIKIEPTFINRDKE